MSASVDQRGVALLEGPIVNKGTAFDVEEPRALGLDALDGRTCPRRRRLAVPAARTRRQTGTGRNVFIRSAVG